MKKIRWMQIGWVQIGLLAALFGIAAWADDSTGSFASSVLGSTPGTTVGGVVAGGAPWVIREGRAIVSGGSLVIEVNGLLIGGPGAPPSLVGTVGPVTAVGASLVCGGSGGAVIASTGAVPFSASGNAHIEAQITVPDRCIAPVVLLRFANLASSQLGPFIALTGF